MKWFRFLSLILAAGVMTSCMDKFEGGNEVDNPKGNGYANVSINLPSVSGATKANDVFDDGRDLEYKVNDVTLALFYGADEATATCKWATDLSSQQFHPEGGNVTTRTNFIVEDVLKPEDGEKVFALVIINKSGYFSVVDNKLLFDINGAAPAAFEGNFTTFCTSAAQVDLSKIAKTEEGGNFMMTNAPISDKASPETGNTSPKITTLVELPVYFEKSYAEAATPKAIYVERVAAKVNVKVGDADNTLEVSDAGVYPGASVEFTGWALQNTNKSTYLVRNVEGWNNWITYFSGHEANSVNRFIGSIPNPYRTYWGVDPNYNTVIAKDQLANNFNILDENTVAIDWKTMANNSTAAADVPVAYCAENTTTAKAMQENQLTQVLIRANFKIDGIAQDFFTCNNLSAIYKKDDIIKAFTASLALSEDTKLQGSETLSLKEGAEAGVITTPEELRERFEITGGTKGLDAERAAAILADYSIIRYYRDGVTFYYTSLIKHFGDETPVNNIETLDSYLENLHLGRYGVLRNNWYELSINNVSGPGSPEIPELPEEPADKVNSYINCTINVLSWAKRTQGVDL